MNSNLEFKQQKWSNRFYHLLHMYPTIIPLLILLFTILIFGLIVGDRFLHPFNLSLITQQVSIIGILSVAQTLVILNAGIDLSVGAIMVLTSVIMGKLAIHHNVPDYLAILIGFFFGTLCGFVNGILITRFKMPPFIVTLGTWKIFFAINLWYSKSETIRSQDIAKEAPLLQFLGTPFSFLGATLTYGSVFMIFLFFLFAYILRKTRLGKHIYAVGNNKESSNLAGVKTKKVETLTYTIAGFVCALGAWALIGRIGSVTPHAGQFSNLESISAVVIGGTSLFGGRGSILGSLLGALIVGVFASGLKLAGLDVQWQEFALGSLIILAVAIDQKIRKFL